MLSNTLINSTCCSQMSDSCVCMCEKWLLNHTEVGNHLFLTPSFPAQRRQLLILVFCHTEKLCLGKFSALLYRYKISVLSALCPDVMWCSRLVGTIAGMCIMWCQVSSSCCLSIILISISRPHSICFYWHFSLLLGPLLILYKRPWTSCVW